MTWGSFNLTDNPPTVTIQAAYSKHRRDDTLPLAAATAVMLARWCDESGDVDSETPLFATMPEKLASMIRVDLSDAGILYRDAAGRVVDFHALRHTFVTNLARGGVHPRVAQALARHSDINLTMSRYTHTVLGDLADGLDALPDLSPTKPESERQRMTGTCDIAPKRLPICLPKSFSGIVAKVDSERASFDR